MNITAYAQLNAKVIATHKTDYWLVASNWMMQHHEVPVFFTLLYLVTVFGGQQLMQSRQPFHLKTMLGFWNLLLALFSIIGAVYTVPPIFTNMKHRGITHEMCTLTGEIAQPWVFLFCISKIPEFVDTFFIVLRKKPLRFLHWYHHIATMLFCWYSWAFLLENGGFFAAMNLLVHSIMYTYYAMAEFGVVFPNILRAGITSLQIIQMLLGTFGVVHNLYYCNTHPVIMFSGLVMYLSYAWLFIDLFIKYYITKTQPAGPHKNGQTNGKHLKAS